MYNIYIPQSKGEQVMAKKINLEMTSVENREMRLGTIIAWDGAASELVKESDYEGRKEKRRETQQRIMAAAAETAAKPVVCANLKLRLISRPCALMLSWNVR